MKKSSICFFSTGIYHLLADSAASRFCGGAELQQLLIGRELVARGYSVSFVTVDHGQGPLQEMGPFRVFGAFRPQDGLPLLRFFHPRWSGLTQALRRADADIYYMRGAGFQLLPIALYTRRAGKRVVFAGASDSDFALRMRNRRPDVYRILYWTGLRMADAIVAQNRCQASAVWENLGKRAPVIHNGLPEVPGEYSEARDVLWVGNIRPSKSPERFVDLAEAVPDHQFVMVGGIIGNTSYPQGPTTSTGRAASSLPNMRYVGFQPPGEVERYYGQARILVNTSDMEGFPNTFLHAWSRGVPVLTFVDPDSLVREHKLGWVVQTPEEMAGVLRRFLAGELEYSPEHIAAFFRAECLTARQVDRYEAVFSELVDN